MPTFAASITTDEETDTISEKSEQSFDTAEERVIRSYNLQTVKMANIRDDMAVDRENTSPVPREENLENNSIKLLIEKLEERDRQREAQLEMIQSNMMSMMSMMQEQSRLREQVPLTQQEPRVLEIMTFHTKNHITETNEKCRMETFKWLEPYDHTDSTRWNSTHGLLNYIYQRDVVEKGFLQPSDFFMQLFNLAVTGTAKVMITGQFEGMMMRGETWNGLGLLKEMDESFRDQNAEESAAALLHACKQFKDEALSSFLPRYQRLLVRSPSSTSTDKQKSFQLSNALNQTTQNYMIGRDIPDRFVDFIKYLSVVGSQVERVGMVRTRVYFQGQVGIFDDGTRGITGGKLLGGKPALTIIHLLI